MIVYVETNFLLELALQQEQHDSCTQIVQWAEQGRITLVIPAFSLTEPYNTLQRRDNGRKVLATQLRTEFKQLERTASYRETVAEATRVADLLTVIDQESNEQRRRVQSQLLQFGTVIAQDAPIVQAALNYEASMGLTPPDALVFASVMGHLQHAPSETKLFLNRNSKDFDAPDVKAELRRYDCSLLTSFDAGVQQMLRSW